MIILIRSRISDWKTRQVHQFVGNLWAFAVLRCTYVRWLVHIGAPADGHKCIG